MSKKSQKLGQVKYTQFAIIDTEAEMPAASEREGSLSYCKDTKKLYKSNGTSWNEMATGTFSGCTKITVGTTEPTSPSVGDLWIDTT